jgi:hypothetical protein
VRASAAITPKCVTPRVSAHDVLSPLADRVGTVEATAGV